MGLFDDIGGLGLASLGLGAAGDIFGAYSQQQAAQRQRALYNQYLTQRQQAQDPNFILSQATPYYNANIAALKQGIPDIMRSTVNPMLGTKGIDPGGGLGQELTQQALAPYYQQAWQQALGQATGQQNTALSALSGATGNVGQPSGQLGGTANALQSLMLWRALQGRQPTTQDQTGFTDTSGLGGGGGGSYTGTTNPYSVDLGVGGVSPGAVFGGRF